jgi:hypothetical protein
MLVSRWFGRVQFDALNSRGPCTRRALSVQDLRIARRLVNATYTTWRTRFAYSKRF